MSRSKSKTVYGKTKCLVCGRDDLMKTGLYTCYNPKKNFNICDDCRPKTLAEVEAILLNASEEDLLGAKKLLKTLEET